MTIYITSIPFEELGTILNITTNYRYLDIDNLIKVNGMKISKEIHRFVLNNEIQRTLEKYVRYSNATRYLGIIYHNSNMTADTVKSLQELECIDKVICLDYWQKPLKKEIYNECDEVIMI